MATGSQDFSFSANRPADHGGGAGAEREGENEKGGHAP